MKSIFDIELENSFSSFKILNSSAGSSVLSGIRLLFYLCKSKNSSNGETEDKNPCLKSIKNFEEEIQSIQNSIGFFARATSPCKKKQCIIVGCLLFCLQFFIMRGIGKNGNKEEPLK